LERNDINNVANSIIWQNLEIETQLHVFWRYNIILTSTNNLV
jgi:hypothetical protein